MDRGTHGMRMSGENGRMGEDEEASGGGEGICAISTSKGQSWRGDRLPWRTN